MKNWWQKAEFLQQFHFLGWHCEAIAAPVILSHSCLLVHLIALFFIRILSHFFTSLFWISCWSDLRSDLIHRCCSDNKPVPVISRQCLWAMSVINNMFMFDIVYMEDNHIYSALPIIKWLMPWCYTEEGDRRQRHKDKSPHNALGEGRHL